MRRRPETSPEDFFTEVDIKLLLNSLSISPQLTSFVSGAIDNIYSIVTNSGVQLIIFLAGLQSISPAIYESATVEGATWWESFFGKSPFP